MAVERSEYSGGYDLIPDDFSNSVDEFRNLSRCHFRHIWFGARTGNCSKHPPAIPPVRHVRVQLSANQWRVPIPYSWRVGDGIDNPLFESRSYPLESIAHKSASARGFRFGGSNPCGSATHVLSDCGNLQLVMS